jgi:ketosteroid isomerase-like protein
LATSALLTLSAWSTASPVLAADTQVVDGLSEPVKAWVRAVETGDATALERMNPASTVAYPPDTMIVRGTENIVRGYRGMFEKFITKAQIKDAHYLQQGGLVVSWGLYTLTLLPKDGGAPIEVNGRFTDVARQAGGQWQYIVDHASLPQN